MARCGPRWAVQASSAARVTFVQRDGAFGGELAEGDLEPAAVAGEVEQAVQLEVAQFAQAKSSAAQDRQRVPGEGVGQLRDGSHQVSVVVGGQRPGQRSVQPGDVPGVDQRGGRAVGPAPDGEVLEERAQVDHGSLGDRGRDWLVSGDSPAPGPAVVVGEESLKVGAGQLWKPGHLAVVGGEVFAEHEAVRAYRRDHRAVARTLRRSPPVGEPR